MSAKRPPKRRRVDPVLTAPDNSETVRSITDAVTAQVLDNLRAAGIVSPTTTVQSGAAGESTSSESRNQGSDTPIIHIPAQNIASTFDNLRQEYKPLGRPLYTKINSKLQEKILSREFIDMSDILVNHQPAELNLHLAVKNQQVGLTSSKKRKFVSIETWTDAFCIFASVLRKANPHPTLAEDLAIYMDLIRQVHRDGGDWYFYDTNFRQARQNDDTLSWGTVDQVLHTRALNKHKQNSSTITKPFPKQASRKTCFRFNGGRACDGTCGYLHACYTCKGNHPNSQCTKPGSQSKGGFEKKGDSWGNKKSQSMSYEREQTTNKNYTK